MLTVYSRLTTSSGRGRFSRLEAGAALGCFGLESLPIVMLCGVSGEGRVRLLHSDKRRPRRKA